MVTIGFREVTIGPTSLVESGANIFTQVTTNLASYFSAAELEAGVVLVEVDSVTSPLSTASAANVVTFIDVQVTKKSKTAVCALSDSDLVYWKRVYGGAGANATCINFQTSHVWPNDGKIQKSRAWSIDKNSPNIYCSIKSDNQNAVRDCSMRLLFAFKTP